MDPEPEGFRSSTETTTSLHAWTDGENISLIHRNHAEIATRKGWKYRYLWHGLSYTTVILLTSLISIFISMKGYTRSDCSCSLDATSHTGSLQADLVMVNSTPDEPVENALSNEMKLQKAWDTLAERSDGVTVVVPEKLEQERGILPESPKVTRNGVSGYLVTLDSMHQANCVDAAWRRLWFNHEDDKLHGPMANHNISDQWYKDHITHCLKILKQSILCKMNVDMVMGYIQWNKSDPNDFIHFEKNHICKNYTKVLGWIKNKEEP
ncbi:uncharacterized protein SETTUDRAFT_35759 [Exserohilum turcica Et28A]|uniref:Uncharacterized protein n=1 Tax=Exserohilum turcicum (strain 28A) TaxID=671987 RepID=R0JX59_EXST2|nr:uncharacterized protein SETTUDRAFT_35759 [Exserohilum turcica Et28A]EOA80852.1 hypothetical protein SETTUDRAFT_35759 [Exserohilum turcica Et28A]